MKIKNIYCVIVGVLLILSGVNSVLLGTLDCGDALFITGGIMNFIAIKKNIFLLFSSISIFVALVFKIEGFFCIGYLVHALFWILNIVFYEKSR